MGSSKKPAKYKTLNSEDYALEIERELLRIIKNVERKIRDKRTATNKVALKRKKGARTRVRKKAASKKKRTKK